MKNKKPETIADLYFDWIFTEEHLHYANYVNLFNTHCSKFRKYNIKPGLYKFLAKYIVTDDYFTITDFSIDVTTKISLLSFMYEIHCFMSIVVHKPIRLNNFLKLEENMYFISVE